MVKDLGYSAGSVEGREPGLCQGTPGLLFKVTYGVRSSAQRRKLKLLDTVFQVLRDLAELISPASPLTTPSLSSHVLVQQFSTLATHESHLGSF